ncbi:HDOD domain-containing protein [Gemmatimonas sp.]|uniref:HDOD domain-containing protein n=1 Tax=Gemmatimonas sp. TaxID=1962908 RepID=UPI0037C1801F
MLLTLLRRLVRRPTTPVSPLVPALGPPLAQAPVPRLRPERAAHDEYDAAPKPWVPRDLGFWVERRDYVLARLDAEWRSGSDAAKWPDVEGWLALLAEEPADVIRQLPAAARDTMGLCHDESLSRAQLADRLSADPALVQSLLKAANGTLYAAGLTSVLRLDAAIDRIGLVGTQAVVLATCLDGLLSKPGGAYDAMVADVWSHMVSTAPLARPLATACGADPEEAFAVALLHDVGKLVMFDRISELRTTGRRPIQLPQAWLSLALAHLHEPLGALAAHQWGLGPVAADAIGLHHRRERPATTHPLAEVVYLAERADHARRSGVPLDFEGIWTLGELNADQPQCRGILGRYLETV